MEQLLLEIRKFREWANAVYPGMNQNEIPGEWETGYCLWKQIKEQFYIVLENSDPDVYTDSVLSELVYIIARDNEVEDLADCVCEHDKWFLRICELSLETQENETKWQLAARLDEAKDRIQACRLLERFIMDEDEYVRRRALLVLPKLMPEKVEQYAVLFWNQDQYGDRQEYQRMAILTMLLDVHSPLLPEYLNRAKEVGGTYLLQCVNQIQSAGLK